MQCFFVKYCALDALTYIIVFEKPKLYINLNAGPKY